MNQPTRAAAWTTRASLSPKPPRREKFLERIGMDSIPWVAQSWKTERIRRVSVARPVVVGGHYRAYR